MFKVFCSSILALTLVTACSPNGASQVSTNKMDWSTPDVPSLDLLSIESLRNRSYGSEFQLIKQVENNSQGYNSYMASYRSDEQRIYARIDIPNTSAPSTGFPVLLHSHGLNT